MRAKKSILIGFGILMIVYAGHHAILIGQRMLADGQRRLACSWLSQELLNGKLQSFSTPNNPLEVVRALCWQGSQTRVDKIFLAKSNIAQKGKNKPKM